jgi:hypothetical protein
MLEKSPSTEVIVNSKPENKSLLKRVGVYLGIAALLLSTEACANGNDGATKKVQSSKTTTSITPSTTTTVSPLKTNPSSEFLGAMEIVRKGPDEKSSQDSKVVHRLNNGIWTETPYGESVDPNSMYYYGFVYNQNTAPLGTPGETSLISGHDVTQINAPITLDGNNYNQTEVTHSVDARPVAGAPNLGIGNMELGDEFIIYLNKPGNKEEVLTYTIDNRYIISQNDNSGVQALANKPTINPNSNQLTYYDCWEPYTKDYFEVFNASLTSEKLINGNSSIPGPQPPVINPSLS